MANRKRGKAKKKKSVFFDGGNSALAILTLLFLVLGTITGILVNADKNTYRTLSEAGTHSEATVIRVADTHSKGGTTYTPIGSFVANGKTIQHTFDNVATGYSDVWKEGASFPIAYDPSKPDHAIGLGSLALERQAHDVSLTHTAFIGSIVFAVWYFVLLFAKFRKKEKAAQG